MFLCINTLNHGVCVFCLFCETIAITTCNYIHIITMAFLELLVLFVAGSTGQTTGHCVKSSN